MAGLSQGSEAAVAASPKPAVAGSPEDLDRSRTRSCPPLKGGRNTTPLIGNKKVVISIWIWMTHMLLPLKAFQTMDRTALNPSSMLPAGPTGREDYLR